MFFQSSNLDPKHSNHCNFSAPHLPPVLLCDTRQAYSRQASPGPHSARCSASAGSKVAQGALAAEKRLPQEKHCSRGPELMSSVGRVVCRREFWLSVAGSSLVTEVSSSALYGSDGSPRCSCFALVIRRAPESESSTELSTVFLT